MTDLSEYHKIAAGTRRTAPARIQLIMRLHGSRTSPSPYPCQTLLLPRALFRKSR